MWMQGSIPLRDSNISWAKFGEAYVGQQYQRWANDGPSYITVWDVSQMNFSLAQLSKSYIKPKSTFPTGPSNNRLYIQIMRCILTCSFQPDFRNKYLKHDFLSTFFPVIQFIGFKYSFVKVIISQVYFSVNP